MKKVCMYCREELRFERGKGWTHADGELYRQRPMTDDEKRRYQSLTRRELREETIMIDDHAAFPVDP